MESQLKITSRESVIIKIVVIALGVALPLKDQWSTIAMIACLALGLFFALSGKRAGIKQSLFLLGIPTLILLPRILGFIIGDPDIANREFVRSLPLLIIPLAMILLARKNSELNADKYMYYGLLAGIVIAMAVCYYPIITTMIREGQPISFLARWRYTHFNFTEPLDLHPAYLGMLIVWVLLQTLYGNVVKGKWQMLVVAILIISLFQLVARNAMLISLILLIIYVVRSKNRWLQLGSSVLIVALALIVIFHPSDFLRDKFMYSPHDKSENKEYERFGRLQASMKVFKMAPVFGVGPGIDNELRKKEYEKTGDTFAAESNHNAHNQFVEFLSTYGIFGLCCFLLMLIILFRMVMGDHNWIYLILLFAFVLASLTESVLERSLGVKYLSILIGLIFWKHQQRRYH